MNDVAGADEEDSLQAFLDGIVGEDMIRASLGPDQRDLDEVTRLTLRVNTSSQSLLDLPSLLPGLRELCLDGSYVASIRDLGTGLRLLTALSINNCELNDLDGIGAFGAVTRLSASNNYIGDLTPLALHDKLEELILDGNKISVSSLSTKESSLNST
jgi:Leucine-rich repeat (LRR) protein